MENVSIIPGLSDYDIVLAKVKAKPEISKQVPRTMKADWDQLKQSMRDLHSELTQSNLATTTSVQSMWDRFATKLEQILPN